MNAYRASFFLLTTLLIALSVVGLISAYAPLRPLDSLHSIVSTRVPVIERDDPNSLSRENNSAQAPAVAPEQPDASIAGVLDLAHEMLDFLRHDVRDYRATLVKRERIAGRLGGEVRMELKVRNPSTTGLSTYLKFVSPKTAAGREVIWVDGQRDSRLVAHEGGLLNLMRVELVPESRLAMLGNKYPITEIGLVRLVEKLIEKCDRGVDLSQCRIEMIEDQRVGDRTCRLVQVTQPKSLAGADFYIAQVFVDMERRVPLRYAAFMWPEQTGGDPPLEEEYTYLDLELNVGLSDEDFDPSNPAYNYPSG